MSKVVDQKVVSLKMDNSDLIAKASQSLKALIGLNKGIAGISNTKIGGNVSQLSKIARATEETSEKMDRYGATVEKVGRKFTPLGIMATTALGNITNRLMNSIHPLQSVTAGFEMYGNKIKSVGVMQANLGDKSSLPEIEASLDRLNTYANQTVYSFEDMTTNMGTFTAAGVGLKDSETAIMGISNLAAASGASTQQAGQAMYQLSQAIAAGSVKLQDWNSVVNAGMGGQKFQKALEQTAKELGHGRDMSVSFRESLKDGWITSDVLLKTLDKFSKDPAMLKLATQAKTFGDVVDNVQDQMKSGWAAVFSSLFGNIEESTQLWTGLLKTISSITDPLMTGMAGFAANLHDWGVMSNVVSGLANIFKALQLVFTEVGKAFAAIFPGPSIQKISVMSQSFKAFTAALIPGAKNLKKIQDVAKGVFSVFHILTTVIGAVIKVIWAFIPKSAAMGQGLLDLLAFVGRTVTAFDKFVSAIVKVDGLANIIQKVVNAIASLFGLLVSVIVSSADGIIKKVRKLFSWLGKLGAGAGKALGAVFGYFGKAGTSVGDALDNASESSNALIKAIGVTNDVIRDAFSNIASFVKGMVTSIDDFFTGLANGTITAQQIIDKALSRITKAYDVVSKAVTSAFKEVVSVIKGGTVEAASNTESFSTKTTRSMTNVSDAFKMAKDNLVDAMSVMKDKASDVWGNIVDSADNMKDRLSTIFSNIDKSLTGTFGSSWTGIKDTVGSVADWVGDKVGKVVDFFGKLKEAVIMIGKGVDKNTIITSLGLGTLIYVLKKLAEIVKGLGNIKTSVTNSIDSLTDSLKHLGNNGIKPSFILALGAGLLMLADAMEKISDIDAQDISKSLLSLGTGLTGMVLAMKVIAKMGKSKNEMLKVAFLFTGMAKALNLFAEAVGVMAQADPERLAGAMLAMGYALVGMVAAIKFLSENEEDMSRASKTLMIVAGSMYIVAQAINTIAQLNLSQLAIGLGGFAVGLGLVVAAVLVLNGGGKGESKGAVNGGVLIQTGASFMMIATSLTMLTAAVAAMAFIPIAKLAKGLASLGLLIAAVVLAAKSLDKEAKGAGTLMALAGAMNLMVVPLLVMAVIPFAKLAKGVLVIAGVIGLLTLAANALDGSTTGALTMVAMAGAITMLTGPLMILGALPLSVIGTGLLAMAGALGVIVLAAYGLQATSVGLLSFAAAIGSIALVIVAIGVTLTIFNVTLTVMATTSVAAFTALGAGLVALSVAIRAAAPMISAAITAIIVAFVTSLTNAVPQIAEAGLVMITGLLKSIRKHIGEITTVAADIIVNFITALTEKLPDLIEAGTEMMISFLNGLANSLRDNRDLILQAVFNILEAILEAVIVGLTKVVDTVFGGIPVIGGAMKSIGDGATKALRGAFKIDEVADEKAKKATANINAESKNTKTAGTNLGKAGSSGAELGAKPMDTIMATKAKSTVTALNKQAGAAHAAGDNVGKNAKSGVDAHTDLSASGNKAGSTFSSGVSDKTKKANRAGTDVAKAGKTGAGSVSFHSTGANAGKGFAEGLSGTWKAISDTASTLAKGAVGIFRKVFDIHSPSKVMHQIGDYVGQGLANGIGGTKDKVVGEITSMADATIDRTKTIADAINSILDQNLEYNPRIKPVLDTSDMSGSFESSINGLAKRADSANGSSGDASMISLLQSKLAQSDLQNSKLQESLTSLNGKLDEVIDAVNAEKTTIVQSNMDGEKVSKAIGEKMEATIADIKLKNGRLRGEF